MGKWCLQASWSIFYRIFVKLAGNQNRHKILDEVEFRPDQINHFGVTCPWGWIKFSIDIRVLWNLPSSVDLSNSRTFRHTFLGNCEDWNLVHTWAVGRCIMCTGIRLLLLIYPFISSFFFHSNFQHWNFSSNFSRELWGLEDWNLVYTWTVGRCIMCDNGILCSILYHSFVTCITSLHIVALVTSLICIITLLWFVCIWTSSISGHYRERKQQNQ